MLLGIPFLERRELLRDCREQANNDTDGRRFHVVTEFGDNLLILCHVSSCYLGDETKD